MEHRKTLNLQVWGAGGCGRRSLIYRAIRHTFIPEYDPVGEDSLRKTVSILNDTQTVIIDLFYFNGDPDYSLLMSQWIKGCDGLMLAYASNSRRSFEEVRKLHDLVCEIKERYDMPVIVVETKADLQDQREVAIDEGVQLAKELNAPFFSTSAKHDINVHEAVQKLAEITYTDVNTERTVDKKGKTQLRIPPYREKIEKYPSTMRSDIEKHLFNNPEYSDLTIICNKAPIYVHKPILVSRWPSFMEQIKPTDTRIELEPKYNYRAMLDLFHYIYTGQFDGLIDEDLRLAVLKWQVYTLLPLFKEQKVNGFDPSFDRMLNFEFMSDVKVILKSHNDRTLFAHRAVLCVRSEYFRTMYKAGFKESNSEVLEVEDCDYDTFILLLNYYYLDRINITQNNFTPLLKLSHRYNERPILRAIEAYLQDHLTIQNVGYVLKLAETFDLIDLKNICEHFIVYRFDAVAKTSGFKKLPQETKTALEAIKKPNNYQIEKDPEDLIIKRLKLFKL